MPNRGSGMARIPDGDHMCELVEPGERIVVVTSDEKLVAAFQDGVFCYAFHQVTGRETNPIELILSHDPKAIIVAAGKGALTNWFNICSEFKKKNSSIPVILCHHGGYDQNLEHIADVEAPYPQTSEDRDTLLWEVVRLIRRIRRPQVSLVQMRSLPWQLTIGLAGSLIAGSLLLFATANMESATLGSAATLCATTAMEILDYIRRRRTRRIPG